jgi:hypothetical protein
MQSCQVLTEFHGTMCDDIHSLRLPTNNWLHSKMNSIGSIESVRRNFKYWGVVGGEESGRVPRLAVPLHGCLEQLQWLNSAAEWAQIARNAKEASWNSTDVPSKGIVPFDRRHRYRRWILLLCPWRTKSLKLPCKRLVFAAKLRQFPFYFTR